ncbi:MAG: sialidase-1 [Planctomycetota bacterium]|jgi:sialidase-1
MRGKKINKSTWILLTFLLMSICTWTARAQEPTTRIACVGDSITYGVGIANRARDSYPAQLQSLLGSRFEVRNFGLSGSGVLKKAQRPNGWKRHYASHPEFKASIQFNPDIVIINLGINDVAHWPELSKDFVDDYIWLIKEYRSLKSKPEIYLWHDLAPLFPGQKFYGKPEVKALNQAIEKVAQQLRIKTIDLAKPLIGHPEWFPDSIHPNEDGARHIAEVISLVIVPSSAEPDRKTPMRTSYEDVKPTSVKILKTEIGTWTADAGHARIDGKHARTGSHCLQILGGKKKSVEFTPAKHLLPMGEITFFAERWTRRSPFEFSVEKLSKGVWTRLYSGDATITIGGFNTEVRVIVGDENVERLRFQCTSPQGTGILIDDMTFGAAIPQAIVTATVIPFTLPALIGIEATPLVCVRVDVVGTENPLTLSKLTGDVTLGKNLISSLHVFATGQRSQLRAWNKPGCFLLAERLGQAQRSKENFAFRGKIKLKPGSNYLWIAGTLRDGIDIDKSIVVRCKELTFSDGSIRKLKGRANANRLGIALRKSKEDGVHTSRIPGLVTTTKGTLIAVFDLRHKGSGDLPGDIDVAMTRSTDGGRTWTKTQTIMDMGTDQKWGHEGIGDPSILVDRKTNTIWVAAVWSHGNRGWNGSGPGMSPEETGQFMLAKSTDDGLTWSNPINITSQIKRPEWCFLLQGPGKGITMSDGTLVFPAQYQDTPANNRLPRSTIIYSKDHGKTWKIGTGAFDDTTEAQVVEIEPGVLMLNCRYNRSNHRVVMITRDMGATWEEHESSRTALIEPRSCMASLIRTNELSTANENSVLLFSNPNNTGARRHVTIKASSNNGATWPPNREVLLDEGIGAGYSCLTMIDENTVGILYEGSLAHLIFQRVKLEDFGPLFSQSPTSNQLDIFVLTGQSNSLGTTADPNGKDVSPGQHDADQKVQFFWCNRSTRISKGQGKGLLLGDSKGRFTSLQAQQGEGANKTFWGPEFGFGRELYESGRRNFAIIKVSRAGGGNAFWAKGNEDDHMYHLVVDTVHAALSKLPRFTTPRIRALLYLQGESDNTVEAELADQRLENLAANLREDLPNAGTMKVLVASIAAEGPTRDIVRKKQASLATRSQDMTYVNTLDLRDQLYDRVHFDKPAKIEIGRRLAAAWNDASLIIEAKKPVVNHTRGITLDEPFGNDMVLPRNSAVSIGGMATPRTTIRASFAGQEIETRSDQRGSFRIELAPMQASADERVMTISDGRETARLTGLVVGDVWLCAGQSNMNFAVKSSLQSETALQFGDEKIRLLDYRAQLKPVNLSYAESTLRSIDSSNFYRHDGWDIGGQQECQDFSAVGWYFATKMQRELNVPIGLIDISVGGAPIETFLPHSSFASNTPQSWILDDWLNNDAYPTWCRERARLNLQAALGRFSPHHPFEPTFLFHAGVQPLSQFPIQGVLWYQGESNATTELGQETPPGTNAQKLKELINTWRATWNRPTLPFLMVQLPAMNRNWMMFREVQQKIADEIEGVELAITIDVGDVSDLHPKNKRPVGERLAALALNKVHNKDVPAFAPRMTRFESRGHELTITFDGPISTRDSLAPFDFVVAGDDRTFHDAVARIEGDTVIVSAEAVQNPVAVRYAWLPVPVGQLVGKTGLPVAPFRTDDW